ncbi:hypothetical protein Q5P01_020590 [Channa striata]|uniref:Uncharacterized protein n=1 Tax=Channa striata TaxID=64152 RepID=A0AA88SBI7_CHASR|nr:hypothetical protein Q5P01_020590 [Channa striata]
MIEGDWLPRATSADAQALMNCERKCSKLHLCLEFPGVSGFTASASRPLRMRTSAVFKQKRTGGSVPSNYNTSAKRARLCASQACLPVDNSMSVPDVTPESDIPGGAPRSPGRSAHVHNLYAELVKPLEGSRLIIPQ